jgi:hypothetical protein
MMREALDTSKLGPVRITPPRHSRQARRLLAEAIEQRGPGWANAADSVRGGGYGNAWTEAALAAIDKALRTGPDDDD